MNKISQIISMPLINIYESKCEGNITEILFDNITKKATTVCLIDEENYNTKKTFQIKSVYKIGEDAILIKNNQSLLLYDCDCRINKTLFFPNNNLVYDLNGKMLGTVIDIIIDENYNIDSFILNNKIEINKSQILTFNSKIVIVKYNNINLAAFKNTSKIDNKNNNDIIVHILNESGNKDNLNKSLIPLNNHIVDINQNSKNEISNNNITSNNIMIKTDENNLLELNNIDTDKDKITNNNTPLSKENINTSFTNVNPCKAIANYNFLINRHVTKNIINVNGEVIVRINTIITYKVLDYARKFGKLHEIMQNCI